MNDYVRHLAIAYLLGAMSAFVVFWFMLARVPKLDDTINVWYRAAVRIRLFLRGKQSGRHL